MYKESLVSIIIPVYNVEKYLCKCLDSCLAQTYKYIEIIAVDDGSNDGSGKILDGYTLRYEKIKVVHQENKGVVLARKKGIDIAKGEYLMFLDADDYLPNNATITLLNSLRDNKADISIGGFNNVDTKGNILKAFKYSYCVIDDSSKVADLLLCEKICFSLCGKLYSRKLFVDSIIYDDTIKMGEDAFITLQLVNNADRVVMVSDSIYNYVQHSTSVTHSPSLQSVKTIITFIERTIEFYKKQSYYENMRFKHSLNYFIMKEYFSYLRMNGDFVENQVYKLVYKQCLNDKIACSMTPFWRIWMLKAFKLNKCMGNLMRLGIMYMRKLR